MTKYIINDRATLESFLPELEYQFVDNPYFIEALKKFRKDDDINDLVKYLTSSEIGQAGIEKDKETRKYQFVNLGITLFRPFENKAHHHSLCLNDPDNYKINGDPVTYKGISKINVF